MIVRQRFLRAAEMYREVFEYVESVLGLGKRVSEPERIFGGFMHKMYRLATVSGTYAVKMLDPAVMTRPDAAENYARAERLEDDLADNGIPVARALRFSGRKMHEVGGQYFYVFDWVNGSALGWSKITADHCAAAGALLGRIHVIEKVDRMPVTDEVNTDWDAYIERARRCSPRVAAALAKNRGILYSAAAEYNDAMRRLPHIVTICDGDMDNKNVLWIGDDPVIIDLEALDYGSPYAEAWQLALSWAGGVLCDIDMAKLHAFLDAYSRNGGFDIDVASVYGMGFSWLWWLDYNVRRALGDEGGDDESIALGESESIATVDRIAYYASLRDKLF